MQDQPVNPQPSVLYAGRPGSWPAYEPHLRRAFLEVGLETATLGPDIPADEVEYVIYAPNSGLTDFSVFPRLKAVLSLWAGVETIVGNATIKVPLARMVEPGLREGMAEWCVGHTLRHHLGMDEHILKQDGVWRGGIVPPLARDRRVGVLGLGELGTVVAESLASLNFAVSGWSRSPKDVSGISAFHGEEGLHEVLSTSEILILLLPDTPATRNVLNAKTLSMMPKGSIILNPGRGPLINDADLLDALASGQIGSATLDVFAQEPLPADHPYWSHARVTVTPHIASETRPSTASRAIAENIRRGETGQPLLHIVDRQTGY